MKFRIFVTTLITLMLFFSMPAFAMPAIYLENGETNSSNEPLAEEITNEPLNSTVSADCEVSSLTDKEAKGILDLTHENFQGKEISSDKNIPADSVDLKDLELVGKDNDGETAVKTSPPSKAAIAEQFSIFSDRLINNAFGIGLVLNDTMRVGVCKDLDQERCRINGNGLKYRTSGTTGLTTSVTNLVGPFKDLTSRGVSGLSEEEYEEMQNQMYDKNDLKVKTVGVEEGNQIENSFKTDSYSLRNATTCNNSRCMISSYSAFDKLFNQWFSGEMVVSIFAPTMFNSAARFLNFHSYGPGGGSKLLKHVNRKVNDLKGSFKDVPSAVLGKRRVDAYQQIVTDEGIEQAFNPLTVNRKLFAQGGKGEIAKMLEDGSDLMKLPPAKKKKFFEALNHLKAYTKTSDEQMKFAQKAFNDGDIGLTEFGQIVSKQIIDWDDATYLDFPQWIRDNPDLLSLTGYAVKRKGFSGSTGFVDITTDNTFFFTKGVLKEFSETGNWDNYAGAGAKATEYAMEVGQEAGQQGLQLYKLAPTNKVYSGASVADLKEYLSKIGSDVYTVNVPGRGWLPLNDKSVDLVQSSAGTGAAIDVFESAYKAEKILTPEEFATRIANDRIVKRPQTAMVNINNLDARLRNIPNFADRRSYNALDDLYKREQKMLKDYFSFKVKNPSFYKMALGPAAYWNVKRGIGNEQFSAYMLPDGWTTQTIEPGVDELYNDSYIDIYSNEGSDQGDLFLKAINNAVLFFPNKVIRETIGTALPAIGDKIDAFFGEGSLMRDEVKDIAFYSHNENCSGCVTNLKFSNNNLLASINAKTNLRGFVVEAVDSETMEEEGATLITYAHHANIKGKTGNIDGGKINLMDGIKENKTCEDALREANLGWAGSYAGAFAAGTESLAYFINPGFGVIASGAQQVMWLPKLQDCVDTKEGYYTHFYTPPGKEEAKSKEAASGEAVTDALSDMASQLKGVTSDCNNPVSGQMDKLKSEFNEFSDQAKKNDILQASIDLMPPSRGSIRGEDVFYIWFKDGLMPSGLKTEGKEILKDGNNVVTKDYGNGSISVNGKEIIKNKKEHTGLTIPDNRIPAEVVPETVSKSSLAGKEEIFEVNSYGQVVVKDKLTLQCIKEAIKEQVGLDFAGDELTQAFGKLKLINTEKYQNISAEKGKIYLEGSGPRYEGGVSSKLIIEGSLKTSLKEGEVSIESGEFVGMTFEHGSIVVNEEKNQLVIWLRQHKESVLSSEEVSNLRANLSSMTDPESNCVQPAFELEASGYPNDSLGQQRVKNFNTSVNHLGAFNQFTTNNKIYEFYSKRVASGECKDFFRVIDKDTGEIIADSEIIGGVSQNEDGKISFKTADGKAHSLEFDAKNGVPKISYNEGPSEALRTAQGLNGSFWFDPNSGQWYPENGLQIPLNQAFKDKGTYYGTNEDGTTSGKAGNPMTFNIGSNDSGGFNVPSLPESIAGLTLFISLFLLISFTATIPVRKKEKK